MALYSVPKLRQEYNTLLDRYTSTLYFRLDFSSSYLVLPAKLRIWRPDSRGLGPRDVQALITNDHAGSLKCPANLLHRNAI
jgi:hypothetical protein